VSRVSTRACAISGSVRPGGPGEYQPAEPVKGNDGRMPRVSMKLTRIVRDDFFLIRLHPAKLGVFVSATLACL